MSLPDVGFASGALLALAPLAPGLALWLCRRAGRAAPDAPPPHVALRLLGPRGLAAPGSLAGRGPRGLWLGLGLALALAALARPQWGRLEVVSALRAREVLVALDLSRSMTAEDVAPSRLARARLLLESLLGELSGERVGLVVFAGTAFLQSPLSADTEVLRELLVELDPETLPQGGTDYSALLRTALESFDPVGEADRFLVVLSDGEAHGEAWRAWLPRLRERGVRAIALGIGTPEGAVLRDAAGGLLKDARGAAVLSRLEPGSLRALADETGGRYADAAAWVDLPALLEATVARGREGTFREQLEIHRRERFQWLLAPALALLLIAAWRELPVAPRPRRVGRRGGADRPEVRSRRAEAAAGVLAAALALAPALAPKASAREAVAPEKSPLVALVGELAERPALAAGDLARLAEATLAAAEPPGALAPEVQEGVVGDALSAVDRGSRLDPAAADWAELRRRLEALLRQPPQTGASSAPKEAEEPGKPASGEGREETPGQGESAGESQAAPDGAPGAPGEPGQASASQQARPSEEAPAAGRAPPPGAGEPEEAGGGEKAPQSAPLGALDQPASWERGAPAAGEDRAQGAPEAETRLVGGGSANPEAALHPELAETLGRLQRLRDRDSPGRLFQAMERAEGAPRPAPEGPAW